MKKLIQLILKFNNKILQTVNVFNHSIISSGGSSLDGIQLLRVFILSTLSNSFSANLGISLKITYNYYTNDILKILNKYIYTTYYLNIV